MTTDELFYRLMRDGQPSLVRLLTTVVDEEELAGVLVYEPVGFSDDQVVHEAVVAYLAAHGKEAMLVPKAENEGR